MFGFVDGLPIPNTFESRSWRRSFDGHNLTDPRFDQTLHDAVATLFTLA